MFLALFTVAKVWIQSDVHQQMDNKNVHEMKYYSILKRKDILTVLQEEKSYGDEWWWWLHNVMNAIKTTELYT